MRWDFMFFMVGTSNLLYAMGMWKLFLNEHLSGEWKSQGDRCFKGGLWLMLLCGACIWLGAFRVSAMGLVYESAVLEESDYIAAVESLLAVYEDERGEPLKPGSLGKVALKVNTRSGVGLSTPRPLLRALIVALERRGFARENILIVDLDSYALRQAGILPSLAEGALDYEGCPVLALNAGDFYDEDWFYDSPLPSAMRGMDTDFGGEVKAMGIERKSYLPKPLLFGVDFWINLPVGCDDPALGVDGALANMTLWNVSNSRRFLVNQATASAAVAEIAAIPELVEKAVLHIMPMDLFQFIGGPFFNSLYTHGEGVLRMSSDPVALDRLLYDAINERRRLAGFPEILPMPQQLPFAASLGLGVFEREAIELRRVVRGE
jgi:hypothetical protein